MSFEGIVLGIIANLVVGIILTGIFSVLNQSDRLNQKGAGKPQTSESYSKRLNELLGNLSDASIEIDKILDDLSQLAKDREVRVKDVENNLSVLETRETQAKKRITELENISIPAVEHFMDLMDKGDKKSTKRDYTLFWAGFILSTITSVILKLVGF